ncbi:hypothetical protein Ctob_005783 [Chrysochromulina tobinii]|uniref:Uncharacterized protein n=1 Tax=Chrysochromulina tobinii TaxID=1460289 RepID=A0A0M0JCC4_9EUKA|nr:hypothetical protein Ctob_005783 [Chrysochromulina tobinii]|eukprot:KOO23997.1 hypothetical protein Ctob_005783 [Chrysochromulina sp. CCMP291]
MKLILTMMRAIEALSSESVPELERASVVLRELSSRSGTIGLVAMHELRAHAPLCLLVKRALTQLEQFELEPPEIEHQIDLEPLLIAAGVALANCAYYVPMRPTLHKHGLVELASGYLGRSDALLEVGLGLLQSMSLFPPACTDVMRCQFMEDLPKYLGGAKPKHMRLRALTVVQHLTHITDHARLLIRHNMVVLLLQELNSRPNDDECRYRALAGLINLSAAQPDATIFGNEAFYRCLSQVAQVAELAPMVEHIMHNVSNEPEQVALMRQMQMLPKTFKEGREMMV